MKTFGSNHSPHRCLGPILSAVFLCLLSIPASAREPAPEVKDVDPAAAEKLLAEKPDVIVLDIRTPAEFAEGHLAGAVNIDFLADDFEEKLAPLDRDKTYLVHCRSGGRSGRSLAIFQKNDFRNIYHLTSGMNGWLEAGKAVEK